MTGGVTRLRPIAAALLIAACPPAESTAIANGGDGAEARAGCAAPRGWGLPADDHGFETVRNSVWLDRTGTLHWNGVPIEKERLRRYMGIVATMTPVPVTMVGVDPAAPCAEAEEIVAIVGGAVDCRVRCSYRAAPLDPMFATPADVPPPPRPLVR